MVKITESKLKEVIRDTLVEELHKLLNENKEIDTFINEGLASFLTISETPSSLLAEERSLPNGVEAISSKIIGYCDNMLKRYRPVQSGQMSYWAFSIPSDFFKGDNVFLGNNVRITVFIVNNPNKIQFQGRENLMTFFNSFKSELNNGKLENVDFQFSVVLEGDKDWMSPIRRQIYHEVTHAYKVWMLRTNDNDFYENIEIPTKTRLGKFSTDLMHKPKAMTPTQVDLLSIFQYIGSDERNAHVSGAYAEMMDYIKKHPSARKQEIVSSTVTVQYYRDIMQCLNLISKEKGNDKTIIDAVNTVFNKKFQTKAECIKWINIQIKQLGLFIFKKLGKLYGRVLQDRKQEQMPLY